MEQISIRPVTTADIAALQNISQQTFLETFAHHNTEENMTQYLQEGLSFDRLQTEVLNNESTFFFAELNSEVIGYLKVNTGQSQTELQDNRAIEIERIYVLKAYHGKQVGQQLYDWAIRMGQERQSDYVWLGVWEHNTKALRFYEKNGFVPFDRHIFRLGNDEQTDLLMKKQLA
ncbi:GNAT family N-acetyltransferase [Paraflavitalea pollutisoli]|uniref:GNAT family N-acetyltransferase n=1 Tax=Paraflavitalea pollutisoli TaxID=3034143 RepID=UPI0023ECE2E1|nr:GNAT family N-acetyltransferase [Paraflavitalea sp. H1-2-19X]